MKPNRSSPKSMRQKRILEVAADRPNAAVDELAQEVPSATPDLVERVLEEYGDPASDPSAEETGGGPIASTDGDLADGAVTEPDGGTTTAFDSAASGAEVEAAATSTDGVDSEDSETSGTTERETGQPEQTTAATTEGDSDAEPAPAPGSKTVDPSELTVTERETLRAIQADPSATQRTLAEELGVSAATVSQRVNGIDGFEWSDRASFVATLFDDDTAPTSDTSMSSTDTGDETTGESVTETLRALEGRVETLLDQQGGHTAFDDPELVSKIVRACMDAEAISEDEELRIIRTLIQ